MPNSDYIDKNGKTDAEKYLTRVYDGDIIACRHMRRLAEIMLPRFSEPYKNFHFDTTKAVRPVRYIEKFCRFPEGEKRGQPFILEDYERSAIELAFGFVDDNGFRQFRQVLMMLARKNGKAISLEEELPTPSGWRKMGELHVGDEVFGQDGKPSKIIAESEVFDKPTYLVAFEDGATVKASGDHIWTVRNPGGAWLDTTTEQLADEMALSSDKWEVPLCKPVEHPHASLNLPPYVMGAYCAESGNKIPESYMLASVSQRHDLLDGILYACGQPLYQSLYGEFVCMSVCTHDATILNQAKELASSLGMCCSQEDGHPEAVRIYAKGRDGKVITSIERVPNEPTKCIAIDNDSHLYLVGRQYTATHNTSLLAAIMLYLLTSDSPIELGAEVYCCANSESQARKCFGAADAMRSLNPQLERRIRRGKVQKRGVSGLNYDKTGSFIVPLAAALNRLDGLSASATVYDELAAAVDNGALLDLLEESTSARNQPLTWIISTENYVRENIWDERIEYAHGWLEGSIHDDTFLPILYQLDSYDEVNDESCWPKANPGLLCGVKDWQYLRDRVNRAKQSPRSKPSLLIKEFNLRSNSAASFLTRQECHNPETYEPNPETDRYGVVGFDLADRGDLNAAVMMFMRPGDDRIYERSMFWIAEEQIKINSAKDFKERDSVPYSLWAEKGWLRIVDGDKVDQRVILDWIQELAAEGLYTRWCGFDSWHLDDWSRRELHQLIGESNCIAIPQQAKVLSPAMKEHQIDLRAHRIINPSPVTEWCRANVQSKPPDANNNYFPQKRELKHNRRIDGYMAELFAYIQLKANINEYYQLIGWEKALEEKRG